MILQNKVAIVTGAGQGIGEAVALRFAREGASVLVAGRTLKKIEETARKIQEIGGQSIAVEADVSVAADVTHMVKVCVDKFGSIDILVNNAGMVIRKPLFDFTEEDWAKTMDINLKSVFLCSKDVVPIMIKQGRGKIVNLASTAGQVGCGSPVYAAAKAGVINFTASMALELAPYKINVNAVSPGFIETPMSDPVRISAERDKCILRCIPYGRFGRPGDIASAILFLASDESDYMVGSTVMVDGGMNTTDNCY